MKNEEESDERPAETFFRPSNKQKVLNFFITNLVQYYFSVLGKCVKTFINRNPFHNDHDVIRSRNCFSCFPTFLFPRERVNATKFNTKIQLLKIFEHFNFCHCEKQNNNENPVEDDVFFFFKVFGFFILPILFYCICFRFIVQGCKKKKEKKDTRYWLTFGC